MAKVITISRQFPVGHPRQGDPTRFVEAFWKSIGLLRDERAKVLLPNEWENYVNAGGDIDIKHHTIRKGRRWKTGDMASIRVWSGKPYNSPQILIKDLYLLRVYDITIEFVGGRCFILLPKGNPLTGQEMLSVGEVAKNDGLSYEDFYNWFNPKGKDYSFEAQILCWSDKIKY